MIRPAAAVAAAGLCWLVALAPASALADSPPSPAELVRSLESLEDQIALGSSAAQADQPKLIADIADAFVAADPAVWKAPKNARAAVAYLLSGGRAGAVRTLVEHGDLPADYDKLIKGALAYAEGQDAVARGLLADTDPRTLTSGLGAHLALVQAMLAPDEERPKARKLLDLARLLAPGTLVEEAALRREIFMAGDTGDTVSFVSLSRQYVHRFQNSVYAGNFRQRLAVLVVNLGVSGDVDKLQAIETLLDWLKPDDQRRLYLAIAATAIVQGNNTVGRLAAERAGKLSQPGGPDAARAALYQGAATVVGDDYDGGLSLLQSVDRSQLSKRDAQLYDAILVVARKLRKPAPPTVAESSPEPAVPAPADHPDVPPEGNAVIDLAQKAIANADQVLKEPTR